MICDLMVIEVDNELYEKAKELCASHNISLESLVEEFLLFASDSNNLPELKKLLDIDQ